MAMQLLANVVKPNLIMENVILANVVLAHLSTASNWIGVQTGVHGFDSRTLHKPVVSKTSAKPTSG